MRKYDYIVTGAGAAGLSLLIRLIASGKFFDKKILLLERSEKSINDRTWCFWEKKAGAFEPVVYKQWQKLWFHGSGHSALHDIDPYEYKLIRSIDFYAYCFRIISLQPNITVEYADVERCYSDPQETYVIAAGEKILADYIFNSILFDQVKLDRREYYLLQHFKGWFIETAAPTFNPDEATLMDFRVTQQQGTTFVYVMPFSETMALVEYTLFSKQLIASEEYDAGLKNYCSEILKIGDHTVISEEFGVIPMTNYPFSKVMHRLINLGSAGGQTKASSGYTFQFIQKQSEKIVEALIGSGEPFIKESFPARRFNLYDGALLNILSGNKSTGEEIFSLLFKGNTMAEVLKFLDNETSVMEELKLIRGLPKKLF